MSIGAMRWASGGELIWVFVPSIRLTRLSPAMAVSSSWVNTPILAIISIIVEKSSRDGDEAMVADWKKQRQIKVPESATLSQCRSRKAGTLDLSLATEPHYRESRFLPGSTGVEGYVRPIE